MAKIAIDARIINSGTGRYVERLLTHLEKLDGAKQHEFVVLVPEKDKDYWKPRKKNFRVEVADFANYSREEQVGFADFLKDLNADLVHFCMPQQPVLYRGQSVTTVHDLNLLRITETDDASRLTLKIKQLIFSQLLKRVARKSAAILATSQYTKNDLVAYSHINRDKITVTYEAADRLGAAPLADDPASPASLSKFDGKQFIFYIGRAEPYKNNRGLIKAHQLLLSKFPALELLIASKIDDFRARDQRWVKEEKYKNVTFTGAVSDAQLAWLYEHCAAYVFPSFMEGFGLPGLEAMRHGAPVASSNATCLPEVYGDAALYFDPGTPTQMAKTLEKLLSDEKLADDLRRKGQEQVQKYSWRRMAEQTLEVYEQVLRR